MKRNINLSDISDGKLYDSNDLVKANCFGCENCSQCCQGMGESIVLDPFDIYNLEKGTKKTFSKLLEKEIEINIVDGLTLPNINMKGNACSFFNDEGLCSIHENRPGICRLFPLGRYYTEDGFKYILQVHECPVKNKGKVKIKNWLGYNDIKAYETYIITWHKLLKYFRENLPDLSDENIRILNMLILKTFYETPYSNDFYSEFNNRVKKIKEMFE